MKRFSIKHYIFLLVFIIPYILNVSSGFCVNFTADANCQGAWLFTEGSGTTVADSSANSNAGTFKASGEPAWDATDVNFNVSGSAPNSVNFDGVDDYILVKSSVLVANQVDVSVTGWANKPSNNTAGRAYYCDRGTSGNDIWKINIPSDFNNVDADVGKLNFIHRDDAGTLSRIMGNTQLNNATWYYFAMVKDATVITFYLNGVSDGGGTLGGNDTMTNTLSCRLGGDVADTDADYLGYQTETAVFNRTLDSTEINEIYDYGLEGTTSSSAIMQPIINIF